MRKLNASGIVTGNTRFYGLVTLVLCGILLSNVTAKKSTSDNFLLEDNTNLNIVSSAISLDVDPVIEFPCICLENASGSEVGQFGEIIRITDVSGTNWYVASARGIYDPQITPAAEPLPSDYALGSSYDLNTFATGPSGYQLLEFVTGSDDQSNFYLMGLKEDGEDYHLVLRSDAGHQVIIEGDPCSYNSHIINGPAGACVDEIITLCVEDPDLANDPSWVVESGDASISGSDDGACVNIQLGSTNGTTVLVSYSESSSDDCYSPARKEIGIGESVGSMACIQNVNVSLNQYCELNLTPEALLSEPPSADASYSLMISDLNGNPLSEDTDWSLYVGSEIMVKVLDDCSGNSCWSFVKIEDKRAPVIECFDITVSCIDMEEYKGPFVLDNCSGEAELIKTSEVKELQDCDPDYVYIVTRTYQAVDAFGNTSPECTQRIFVERPDLDAIEAPESYTVEMSNPLSCDGYSTDENGNPDPLVYGVPTLEGKPLYPNQGEFCNLAVVYEDNVLPTSDCVQKIMRTWVVFEWWCTFGEMDTIVQMFNVADMEDPIIDCPDDITVSSNGVTCEGDVLLPSVEATDDCSDDFQVDITYPGGFLENSNGGTISLPLGVHDITYTVYDDCFNSASCSIQVTVVDETAPAAICHQNTVLGLKEDGMTYAYAEAFDDGSYDDCAFDRMEVRRMDGGSPCGLDQDEFSDKVEFCCADVGSPVIIILRVYDVQGNYNECMVNVEIQDKNPPSISCPEDITIDCLREYDINDLSEFGIAMTTDNCQSTIIDEFVDEDVDNCRVGTITRTFVAFDGNGSASCSQTITIINPDPFNGDEDIDWPEDYETDESCNAGTLTPDMLTAPFDRPVIEEDFCDQVLVNYSDLVFSIPGTDGACLKIIRTWTVKDFCQEITEDSVATWARDQIITITNSVAPTITSANDDFTECTFNENCSTGEVNLSAGAEDDCTPGSMMDWSYAIDLDDDGSIDIEESGKGDSINFTDDYPIGTHSIIFTFEDLCGNSSSVGQKFSIENCVGPSAVCIEGISVSLQAMDTDGDNEVDNEMATIKASMLDASSFHPCGQELQFSFSENPADSCLTVDCNDIGVKDVRIYVIDETGRFDFCETTVEVQDNNNVDLCRGVEDCIEMPTDVTITDCVSDLLPETIGSMPNIDPECICTQFTLEYEDTDISDVSNSCTVLEREWTITFTCGFPEVFTVTQIITKFNDKDPAITCPSDVTVESFADACEGDVVLTAPVVNSDCSTDITITNNSQFAVSSVGDASGTYPVGTTEVTYTVTDKCGNVNSCSVNVTVTDDASPVCSTQDITVSVTDAMVDVTIEADQIDNGSFDDCGQIVSRTVSPNAFGCDDAGSTIEVILTVTDDSGNTSTCAAMVTVEDAVAPVCLVNNPNINIVSPGTVTLPVFLVDNGSFDECGIIDNISISPSEFDCDDLGVNDVTVTVTDDSGNSSTCISVVTVNDREDPTCLVTDITVQLDGSDMATIIGPDLDNGSFDGCSGIDTITVEPNLFTCAEIGANDVVVTVTDNAGNFTTCNAVVTVEANDQLVCETQDITVYLDENGVVSISADQVDNGSGIPCADDITLSVSPENFDCDDAGSAQEVTLSVSDGIQTLNCTAMVTVLDTVPPVATCPVDQIVECQDLSADLSVYGTASFTDNCGEPVVQETSLTNLDDCGVGTITRTFVGTDANGNSSSCVQTISVINPDPFEESDITWPVDTFRITQCTSILPDSIGSEPSISVSNESCSNISVDFNDVDLTNNTNCQDTVSRTWTVIDSCQLDQGSGAGIFSYEQIIIINDEMAPVIQAVDSIKDCVNDISFIITAEDCNDVTISNDSQFAIGNGADISGTYPDGETKVFITAIDRCGNMAEDSIVVLIEPDTIPPSITCINRTIIIEEDGVTEVTAGDSEWYFEVSDDMTPVEDLMFSFSNDFTMDTLFFNCDSVIVKSHFVMLYVKDKGGNVDSCMASYVTQDQLGVCTGNLNVIEGNISTEFEMDVPEVFVELRYGDAYEMTDVSGNYEFPQMENGGSYELRPIKDTDHLAGVSTLDLVLIQRHILGITPILSPYTLIAADINNSGIITAKDILDLKKNLLGLKQEFPNNTSWRFVDRDYRFIDPSNPLNEAFSESAMIYDLKSSLKKDFTAIKVGDINGSIQMKSVGQVRSSNELVLNYRDRIVPAGEPVIVEFLLDDLHSLSAFDLSLGFDKGIEIIDISSEELEVNESDFVINNNSLKWIYTSINPRVINDKTKVFNLEILSDKEVMLSDVIYLTDDLDNSWIHNDLRSSDLILIQNGQIETKDDLQVMQNTPNPWFDKTDIAFETLKGGTITLNIKNATGQLVETLQSEYPAGRHVISLDSRKYDESGVYFYELISETQRITKRMILIK